MSDTISARTTIDWARLSAASLREKRAEINELNVFPIPDSDTGSNMSATMDAACQAVDEALDSGELRLPEDAADSAAEADALAELTALLAAGSVHGARGNSGMVLSQVFRALADTAARGPIDAHAIVDMLEQAGNFVAQVITTPVEGTVITVLREAARGGQKQLDDNPQAEGQLAIVVDAAISSADVALAETTNQLDVLAEAGVVDAGGRGFTLLLYALRDALDGTTSTPASAPTHTTDHAGEIEAMFLFTPTQENGLDQLRETMADLGNSIIVAPVTSTQVKIHVHSRRAGIIIEQAFKLGELTDLQLEALPAQNSDPKPKPRPAKPIIALMPEPAAEADDDVFARAGAISVAATGPSDDGLVSAFDRTESQHIIILANGYDTTELVNSPQWHSHDRDPTVIKTQSLVGGLAALAVFDSGQEWEANLADMTDAAAAQRWENCQIDTLEPTLHQLLSDGGELVTVVTAPNTDGETIQNIQRSISNAFPDVELHNYHVHGLGETIQVGVE